MKQRPRQSRPVLKSLRLTRAPIIEAVLDLDCALPPSTELASLQAAATEQLKPRYPKTKHQLTQGVQVQANAAGVQSLAINSALQSLMFLSDDEKQIVQVRAQGYSFNRLAPYSSLDD